MEFYNASISIDFVYKNALFPSYTTLSYIRNPNKEYLLSINEISPFIVYDIRTMSTNCGSGENLIDPNNKPKDKEIPEYFIHKYFSPLATCGYQYTLPAP